MKKRLSILLSLSLTVTLTGLGSIPVEEITASEPSADSTENTSEIISGDEEAASGKQYAANIFIDAGTEINFTVNGLTDGLCSWSQGGQDAGTTAGDDYSFAPVLYINDDAYDSEKSLAEKLTALDDLPENVQENLSETLSDTAITINREAVNGVIVNNSDYTIENSKIEVNADSADGSTTCDFSGLGSALAVFGDSSVVVKDSILKASGVADMGLFVDNGAEVLLEDVEMSSAGGTLYEGYINSPAQETMAAPPWILGIMGNSRSSNLMGNNSTLTVVDSETSASNWAVLSTDSGSNMALNVVNSSLTLNGSDTPLQADGKFDTENPYTSRSGYGTYVIGNSVEKFLGVTMEVGTYAAIFTGGSAEYSNLVQGESYDLLTADGSTHTTYTAAEDVQTVINSDTFGFMAHQNTNTCTLDGVQVNSAFTNFLVKSGCDTTITVENGAELNAGNGILLQLMDNDDSTTEFDSDTKAFGETHEEYAGFPTEAVADSTTAADHMQPSDLEDSTEEQVPESMGDGNTQNPGSMGDGNAQNPGSASADGQTPPEMPSGDMSGNAQMPSGNQGGNAQTPSGDMSGNAQMPSGDMSGNGQTPSGNQGGNGQMPSGDMSGNTQTPPEMPSGSSAADSQTPPEMPSGSMNGEAPSSTEMPSDDMSGAMTGNSQAGGSSSCNTTVYNVIDTDLEGAIYNGIGWNANELSSGNVKQMQLQVNLSGTSTLKGAIAMTSCIHSSCDGQMYLKENGITAFDEEAEASAFADQYQAVSFSQAEYFNIGQVANLVKSNGLNNIDVTLSDSAVWTVTDTSLVTSVTLSGDAQIIIEEGVTLTVDGKEYTEGTYTASDF